MFRYSGVYSLLQQTTLEVINLHSSDDDDDDGHSKVFATGQARFNPEHYAIKCVGI